jgi:hypothetical protein
MQKAGSITYWFCAAVAVFMILWGFWDRFFCKYAPPSILLLFCLMIAATFYLAGRWVRRMAQRETNDA